MRVCRTKGVPLLFCTSGGCRDGEPGCEGLEPPLDAWYIGNDGVVTLDIFAYPRDDCCAAVNVVYVGATRNSWDFLFTIASILIKKQMQ